MLKKSALLILILTQITLANLKNIGTVTAIRGDVNITRGIALYQAHKGLNIEEKDTFFTSKRSSMQITFSDNTVITLGRNTVFKVNEYLYNEKHKKKSKAKFHFRKGFFKSITGRIGKISANKFQIKTKNSTIGVRGTEITGKSASGQEDIVCTKGVITVSTEGKTFVAKENEKVKIKLDPKVDYVVASPLQVLLKEQVKQGLKTIDEVPKADRIVAEVAVVYKPKVIKKMKKEGTYKKDAPVIIKTKMTKPKKVEKKELQKLEKSFMVNQEFKTQKELRKDIVENADVIRRNLELQAKLEKLRKRQELLDKAYKAAYPKKIPTKAPKRLKDDLKQNIDQMDDVLDD